MSSEVRSKRRVSRGSRVRRVRRVRRGEEEGDGMMGGGVGWYYFTIY